MVLIEDSSITHHQQPSGYEDQSDHSERGVESVFTLHQVTSIQPNKNDEDRTETMLTADGPITSDLWTIEQSKINRWISSESTPCRRFLILTDSDSVRNESIDWLLLLEVHIFVNPYRNFRNKFSIEIRRTSASYWWPVDLMTRTKQLYNSYLQS